MDLLIDSCRAALILLASGDEELMTIVLCSLRVSGVATIIAAIIGLPLGLRMAWQVAVQALHVPCHALLIFSVVKALRRSPSLRWAS